MSEYDLNYVSKSILNVMPDAIDLTKEIKYSSYITRRDFVEVFPVVQPPVAVSASNLGSATRIILSDPARWLDRRSATLQFDIGNLIVPTSFGTYACLDGPCAMISRCNVYVGGQQINGGTINNLNKVASALQLNSGSIASYCSDEASLTGGNERLKCVLQALDTPTCGTLNKALADSPYNFLTGALTAAGVAVGDSLFHLDQLGFNTVPASSKQADGLAANNYYGYSNVNSISSGKQTVSIPLSVLHPFFDANEMLPLYLCKEVVLEIFFASPQQTFCSDIQTGAGTIGGDGAPNTTTASLPITSYGLSNMKICCDLISCSDEINDLYKLKASSSEGLIIPYDDYAMNTKSMVWSAGAAQTQQAILSTNNLKSMIFFRQSHKVETSQDAWSNSNYMYNGIQNYVTTINNTNIPQNPLSTQSSMLAYNMRSRASIHNQLSNCVANNMYVFGKSETVASAITNNVAATDETGLVRYNANVPSSLASFMIYNNYEKIHDEQIDVGNGISLSSAGSMISVKYNEDSGPVATAKNGNGVAQFDAYTLYLLLQYGKALVFADGTIQVRG